MAKNLLDDSQKYLSKLRLGIPKKRVQFWAVYVIATILFVASRDYHLVYQALTTSGGDEKYLFFFHVFTFISVPLVPIWGKKWYLLPERRKNLGAILGIGSCFFGMIGVVLVANCMVSLLNVGISLQVSYFMLLTCPYIILIETYVAIIKIFCD